MTQRNVAILSAVLVVVALVAAIAWYATHGSQAVQVQNASKAPTVGKAAMGGKAPEFSAATTAGPFVLSKTAKPVFLEVFATWCPHCQRETKVIDDLFARYGKRVAFVAVSGSETGMDGQTPASQADVFAFAQRFKVAYPIAYDGDMTVADLYLSGGFPTIAIIGRDKTISYLNSGEIAEGDLAAEIEKVLK